MCHLVCNHLGGEATWEAAAAGGGTKNTTGGDEGSVELIIDGN
jgi:hypothetical protein